MTTPDRSPPPHTESVTLDVELPHPPEKVWRALTEPALLSEWLLPVVDFELEPGTTFTFDTAPIPGWDDPFVSCRILAIEEHRKLVYTWVVGDLDSVLTFTLTPTESGTRLSVVQTGFEPDQKSYLGGARSGWKRMAGQLADLLARMP